MRRVITALTAVTLTAGCTSAPPSGTDKDLTDDWAPLPAPAAYRPVPGVCHEALTQTAGPGDDRPASCDEVHVSETFHVGTPPGAAEPPAPGTAGAKAAYRECSAAAEDFLGGDWRTAGIAVHVVWPTRKAWSGGARWFRCDVTQADLDGYGQSGRKDSLSGELTRPSPLRLGCFDPTVDGQAVTEMRPTPCTGEHRAEFAGLWRAPDVSYEQLQAGTERSAAACRSVIARFAAVPDDSDMQYRSGWISYNPTRTEWLAGERRVRCFVYFAERTLTRSLRNAGPAVLPVD
ncbi:septum formation family protein [Actinoplanes sp. NPDC051346]|uniref:septum formation family protein n=1 Tax=Actinoplanes sp. NPDC051346 TaxID=3155048 RepID=UPI003449BA2C